MVEQRLAGVVAELGGQDERVLLKLRQKKKDRAGRSARELVCKLMRK